MNKLWILWGLLSFNKSDILFEKTHLSYNEFWMNDLIYNHDFQILNKILLQIFLQANSHIRIKAVMCKWPKLYEGNKFYNLGIFILGIGNFFKCGGFSRGIFAQSQGFGILGDFLSPGFFGNGNCFSWDEIFHQRATSDMDTVTKIYFRSVLTLSFICDIVYMF